MTGPSTYTPRLTARTQRDLRELPEGVTPACAEFIAGPLCDSPYRVGGRLAGAWSGSRSARRGAYRVIYRVDDDLGVVVVQHVDHRGRVYNRP